MNKDKKRLTALYQEAKSAKVGMTIQCPSCLHIFKKTHYAQAFCKTKGKRVCNDNYWNNTVETKRNNTTRISPARFEYQ